jgi:hypothetical protein
MGDGCHMTGISCGINRSMLTRGEQHDPGPTLSADDRSCPDRRLDRGHPDEKTLDIADIYQSRGTFTPHWHSHMRTAKNGWQSPPLSAKFETGKG